MCGLVGVFFGCWVVFLLLLVVALMFLVVWFFWVVYLIQSADTLTKLTG